jgi:hypothetical protein
LKAKLATKKVIIPKDLSEQYQSLKKIKLPMQLHDPAKVLSNPEEYRNIIHTTNKSFNNKNSKTEKIFLIVLKVLLKIEVSLLNIVLKIVFLLEHL